MIRLHYSAAVIFTTSLLLSFAGSAVLAQGTTAKATVTQGPAGPTGVSESDKDENRAPVLRITSVEVIRSTHGSPLDIVRVRGLASSAGWEEAELVPLTRGIPADGILELVLVAKAPEQAQEAKGFEVLEAILPLEPNHPYKGINVHGAAEAVSLTQMPGFVDGKASGEDCSKCVGKYFVAKGTSAPSGKAAAEVVKEEQLPPFTHIVRSTDGVGKGDSDPNRLTLIVNKDGRITTAVWD